MSNTLSASDDADNYPANAPALKSIVTRPGINWDRARAVHLNSHLTTQLSQGAWGWVGGGGGAQGGHLQCVEVYEHCIFFIQKLVCSIQSQCVEIDEQCISVK